MLSKEPKDNYNVWLLIKSSNDKNDMHPSKGAKQNAVMFTTLPRPTLLKECVEIKGKSLIRRKRKEIQNDFILNDYFFVTWSNVIMNFKTLHVTIFCNVNFLKC